MSSRHIQSQIDPNYLSRLENLRIGDEQTTHVPVVSTSSITVSQKQQNKIGVPHNLSNRPLPNINYSCVSSVASNYYPGYEYHQPQQYASGAPIYENIDLYEPTYVTRKAIDPQMAHEKQLSFSASGVSSYDSLPRKTDAIQKNESRTNEEAAMLARFAHTPQPSDIESPAPIYENLSKGASKKIK